jgi:hypothetical protein
MVLNAQLLDGPAKLPKGKGGVAQTVEKMGCIRRTNKDKNLKSKYVEVSREMTKLFYKAFSKSHIDRFESDLAKVEKVFEQSESCARKRSQCWVVSREFFWF